MAYILETTNIVVLFAESARLDDILMLVKCNPENYKLETIVVIDNEHGPDMVKEFTEAGLKLVMLSEFMDATACSATPESGNAIAMIMYTSGATGMPKGALLTHKNFTLTNITGKTLFKSFPQLSENLRFFSYLPLAHVMEFGIEFTVLNFGGCIYYYSGDMKILIEELAMVRPTMLSGVPRVYQKIYDKVMLQSQLGLTGFLLRMSLSNDGILNMLPGMR